MQDTQSNLEEKDKPIILKGGFSLRTDSFIFSSIARQSFEWSNETS